MHCSDTSGVAGLLVWLVSWFHFNWCLYPTGWGWPASRSWSDLVLDTARLSFALARSLYCLSYTRLQVTPEGASLSLLISWAVISHGKIECFIFLTYVDFHSFLFTISFRLFFGVFLHAVLGVILANALSSVLLGPWTIWFVRRILASSWPSLH